LQIGYGPHYLSRFMIRRFLPLVLGAIIVAMLLTVLGQLQASQIALSQGLVLPHFPGWPVWGAMAVSTGILVLLVTKSISGAIKKH